MADACQHGRTLLDLALDGEFETSVRYRGEGMPYGAYSLNSYVFHHYQADAEGRYPVPVPGVWTEL